MPTPACRKPPYKPIPKNDTQTAAVDRGAAAAPAMKRSGFASVTTSIPSIATAMTFRKAPSSTPTASRAPTSAPAQVGRSSHPASRGDSAPAFQK